MSIALPNSQPKLPEQIEDLVELALDLRWSWHHAADSIWKRLDPDLWSLTHNPWLVLQTVSQHKLDALAADREFSETVSTLLASERESQAAPRWYQNTHPGSPLKCAAYFSMEFGLSETLPIYSGGLGLLAGDHLKAANDLGVPVIGVGILYQYGYFRQALDADGTQIALYPANNTSELPVTPVRDRNGDWLRLPLLNQGHRLWTRVWQARIGQVTLYLLDSNDPANTPVDRCITTQLYGGGAEQRLQQEILLGIGGWRVLRTLGIEPDICHLNEGHAAFAVLERARAFMEDNGGTFRQALTVTRAGNLFTTHTPVDAGFDRFDPDLVARYLGGYAQALGLQLDELLALGRRVTTDPAKPFNMAYLAIKGSGAINGVSRLHGEVSRSIFNPLFASWPNREVPVGHVTNGVHVPSWDSAESDTVWTETCGKDRWIGDCSGLEEQIRQIPDETLWDLRMQNRRKLVNYARRCYIAQHAGDGVRLEAEIEEEAQHVLDPNILTLGFARRFAAYKRPNLILHDQERLIRLLTSTSRPVQILVAGKAHPQDEAGQQMVKAWVHFARRPEIRHRVLFISDYDMLMAERLVQGVDVWLNNPRRPWEASGTSGMKVLVNGGLNLSELDGWWAEAYTPEVGWALGDGQEHGSDPAWDVAEVESLYILLEKKVIPDFYNRDENGVPGAWVARMRESMARLTPRFSTNRMVREYVEEYYLPCANAYHTRAADDAGIGRELDDWQRELELHWSSLHFGELQIDKDDDSHIFHLPVYLGEIVPDSVRVELYSDSVASIGQVMIRDHALIGAANGFMYTARVSDDRPAADFTPRIVPYHPHANIPLDSAQILWFR